MEDKKAPVNEDFLNYIKNYADVRNIPLSRRKMASLFHTSKTAIDDVSQEKLNTWLRKPDKFYVNIIELSKDLYYKSGEYRSLLNYFIDMARFYYVIDPLFSSDSKMSKEKVKKDLSKISLQLNKMNLKHELAKIYKTCVLEDIFFGYEIEYKDNYFMLKLDPKYCKLVGISDGMYTYAFNLSYFDGNLDLLKTFPEEFQRAYLERSIDKQADLNWFIPDFTKSVVFKINEDDPTILPPFSTMFEPLLDLNDYKKLKKAGAKINNYMLLHQKVPMHDNANKDYQADNFAISAEAMDYFSELVNENLPDEIGSIVSPMEVNPIKLDRDDKTDKVLEATRDVYNASGVSSFIFNNDKNSTGGLTYSVRKDELFVINFYRQVERWLNRKIRYGNIVAKNQWRISLLNVTGMSEDTYLEQLTKSGTFGFSVRGRIAALHGLDYHTLSQSLELENNILDLDTNLIPLASSHTGGLNTAVEQTKGKIEDSGGRPTKETKDLSDSGQANRDSSNSETKSLEGGDTNNE